MPFSFIPFFFFFFLLYNTAFLTSTPIIPLHHQQHHQHHRRILHQPFTPLYSFPPTQPPSSSPPPKQQPKFPFSSGSNNQPFFPSYSSPPPPPPPPSSSYATFPANISSLIFPQSPHHKPFSPKLVILSVILSLLSISFIVAFAVLVYRRRHYSSSSSSFTTGKTSRSDSHRLFPANTAPSDVHHHRVRGISATSSEFLYLGTLVNSRGIDGDGDGDGTSDGAGATPNRKLGSPELHPLPPLSKQNFSQSFGNSREGSSENEEEEFYSPRGSVGSKESPAGTGSSSRRMFEAVVAENFESRSSNSSSPSYPSSNLASRNPSPSPSPPVSISSTSSKLKSPEFVTKLPPPQPPPPPPGKGSESMSSPGRNFLEKDTVSPARSLSEKNPHSPERSTVDMNSLSPVKNSNVSQQKPQSLERNFDTYQQNQQSPATMDNISRQPASIPPPPPPPPPPHRFWEAPILPQPIREPIGLPPELVVPLGFRMPTARSLAELTRNLDSVEGNEEIMKPKLKPLHWDKVRASSDRAMVWDQLKSSSFQ